MTKCKEYLSCKVMKFGGKKMYRIPVVLNNEVWGNFFRIPVL